MPVLLKDDVLSLQNIIVRLPIAEALELLNRSFPQGITFSTSFSYEDQVITEFIAKSKVNIDIFTLDTGRLFPETYSTWMQTLEHFGLPIRSFHPDEKEIGDFVSAYGPNAFYKSVVLRKQCCSIRKVVPLKKALFEKKVWITGLRAQHSPDRQDLQLLEWDETNQLIKYNPLLHWTTEEVKQYIDDNKIPYNSLHDKGFISIGCAPCTRAVKEGEDFRAGRWWWEDATKKECGLHVHETISKK